MRTLYCSLGVRREQISTPVGPPSLKYTLTDCVLTEKRSERRFSEAGKLATTLSLMN